MTTSVHTVYGNGQLGELRSGLHQSAMRDVMQSKIFVFSVIQFTPARNQAQRKKLFCFAAHGVVLGVNSAQGEISFIRRILQPTTA